MMHPCIRKVCGKSYESEDEDAYYCFDCREQNRKTAEKIDAIIRARGPKHHGPNLLNQYDSLAKGPGGFPNAKNFL